MTPPPSWSLALFTVAQPTFEPLFIASGPLVYRGEDAVRQLAHTNDRKFVVAGRGIPSVDGNRWQLAQVAEQSHWFKPNGVGRRIADDRNFAHFDRFARYEPLRGRHFEHALEIGCGPFTNLRLIADTCSIESCTLLDPAMNSYLSHRTRYFDRNNLYVVPPYRSVARAWTRLAPMGRATLGRVSRTVPIRDLLAVGAEESPATSADLVVMVNVIEHCRDADQIIDAVKAAVKPGGILVLSDKCYSAEVVAQRASWVYDQAHPLRVAEAVFRPILDGFRVLFESAIRDVDIEPYYPETFERYWVLERRFEA